MGPIGCLEALVINDQSTQLNITEEQISQHYSCFYCHLPGRGYKGCPFCLMLWLREPSSSVPSADATQCFGNDFISVF